MSQTVFKYRLSVPAKEYENIRARYAKGRVIINKLRKKLSHAILDLGDPSLCCLVGRKANGPVGQDTLERIQNGSEISKWGVEWDQSNESEDTLQGVLSLVLENPSIADATVKMIIQQAAEQAEINLKPIDVEHAEIDYVDDCESHTYYIDNLYPKMTQHWDEERIKKDFSLSKLPQDRGNNAKAMGALIKRHLIETARFNGLDSTQLEQAPLFVQSRIIATPTPKEKVVMQEDYYSASVAVTFSLPFKLEGYWFAGGYRHVNSGSIAKASDIQKQKLKTGGTFVL